MFVYIRCKTYYSNIVDNFCAYCVIAQFYYYYCLGATTYTSFNIITLGRLQLPQANIQNAF
jgi:hypothetical protein